MESMKYLIGIPCMGMVHTGFAASLIHLNRVGESKVTFLANALVYNARNMLCKEAIETGADRILFLDSDMVFGHDLMEKMEADMDVHNLDFVSALCFRRVPPITPLIYKKLEMEHAKNEIYLDYPENALFPIAGAGFGATMISTRLIKDIVNTYGAPFMPYPGELGEDLAFCYRANKLGYKMYCDSRLSLGHIGDFIYGEQLFKK